MRFRLPIPFPRRCLGHQRVEQSLGDRRDLVDRAGESILVGHRGLGEPADLPNVLECGGADVIIDRGRIDVVQDLDVSAHFSTSWLGSLGPGAARGELRRSLR